MPTARKTAAKAAKPAVKKTAKAPAKVASKAMRSCCPGDCTVAPVDKFFWVNNGPVVGDLAALRAALEGMTDEQYAYHTTRAGNDFAKWISEVLGHKACADKVSRAKTRVTAIRAIATCACG